MTQDERDKLLQNLATGQADMQVSQGETNLIIDKIHRGLYGEPENNTIGLIKQQENDDEKFNDIETKVKSFTDEIKANTNFRKSIAKAGKNTLKSLGIGAVPAIATIIAFFEKIKQFFISILHL